MSRGISIIVCVHNGSGRITNTIAHLAAQKVSEEIEWEVIIADNNSIDDTVSVAKIELSKYQSLSWRVLLEERPGKVHALDKAVNASKYDTIIICDDDNWLDESYVQYAFEIISSFPNVGIAVGNSKAVFETGIEPVWFNKFELAFAVGKIMDQTGYANDVRHLAGAGMVVRKEIFASLNNLNFQPVLSGRKGKTVASGEDSELSLLTYFLGYDLYYDERLTFTHYITKNRLNWNYCVKMITKGISVSRVPLYFYNYCYGKAINHESGNFSYAYKRSLTKCLKNIKQECKGIKQLCKMLYLIFFSHPGSEKEVRLKANIEKIKSLIFNKQSLERDFIKINMIVKELALKNLNRSLQNTVAVKSSR